MQTLNKFFILFDICVCTCVVYEEFGTVLHHFEETRCLGLISGHKIIAIALF